MKKISLSSLSKRSMDKLQQSAINGGHGHCICAYICSGCACQSDSWKDTVTMEWWDMNESVDRNAANILNPIPPSV